jgi:hypothetical protein
MEAAAFELSISIVILPACVVTRSAARGVDGHTAAQLTAATAARHQVVAHRTHGRCVREAVPPSSHHPPSPDNTRLCRVVTCPPIAGLDGDRDPITLSHTQ